MVTSAQRLDPIGVKACAALRERNDVVVLERVHGALALTPTCSAPVATEHGLGESRITPVQVLTASEGFYEELPRAIIATLSGSATKGAGCLLALGLVSGASWRAGDHLWAARRCAHAWGATWH